MKGAHLIPGREALGLPPPPQWRWLTALPFGAILFATTGGAARPSLPSMVADGDLDGDLYLAIWDNVRTFHAI